jgi:uncharacterized membrane protein YqjE
MLEFLKNSALLSAGRVLLDKGICLVQGRVELFAAEVQEQKRQLIEAALLIGALTVIGTVGLALITFTVIVVFWDFARIPIMVGLCVVYLAAALILYHKVKSCLAKKPFFRTIEEIEKDRSRLK